MDYFVIDKPKAVVFPTCANHPILTEILGNATPVFKWKAEYRGDEPIIAIGNAEAADLGNASFVLSVKPDGVFIRGKDYRALINGYVTFIEKIVCYDKGVYKVECGLWHETEAIGFRAAHLCIFPETRPDFLRKCVLLCAIAKYSHVILEFWGSFRSEVFPETSWKDSPYTKEVVGKISAEANALGVEVVPSVNLLGHASLSREGVSGKHVVLDQNPALEYMFVPGSFGWVWAFNKQEVRDRLFALCDEISDACGEGSYIHLGFDESEDWGYGGKDGMELADYLNAIAAHFSARGRRAIIWGDMFIHPNDFQPDNPLPGDHYECNNSKRAVAAYVLEHIDKSIIIADWQYNVISEIWKTSKYYADLGFDVICCSYSNRPNIKTAIDTVKAYHLLGYMKTTWATLSREMGSLTFAGLSSFAGDAPTDYHYYSKLSTHTTQIIRRVSPSGGDYHSSGWAEEQVGPGY